jgi:hypothetical protein
VQAEPHTGRTALCYGHLVMAGPLREMTFLVRMWLVEPSLGESQWRGSVSEVASGKRLFVTETRDIADFIDAQLTVEPDERPG